MNNVKNLFINLDKKTIKIMKTGLKISFIICLIAIYILSFYLSLHTVFIYQFGILLLKESFHIAIQFIICGIIIDKIKKE